MKTIGLIGGMSWESSAEYYRLLNTIVRERLGGHTNPKSLLLTVNFAEIEALQHAQAWDGLAKKMQTAALQLQAGGADFVLLCTNTMHKVASAIEAVLTIPFLHIADPTAQAIEAKGLTKVGLLGTRFTMEDGFYERRLRKNHNFDVDIPDSEERCLIHRAIYDELCRGIVREETRDVFRGIIGRMINRGAQGMILGCTELGLLLRDEDSPVPLFDTTKIHVLAAIEAAITDS